jgi:hypothetical protein
MDTTRKFKFKVLIITEDVTLIDQNVWSWTFINIGPTPALINNNYFLAAQTNFAYPNAVYHENLGSNEKTAQGYKIVFYAGAPEDRRIQCIMKVEVKDK